MNAQRATLIALALAVTGLIYMAGTAPWPQAIHIEREHSSPTIFHDAGTGCDYIVAGDQLYPRMQADGSQVCEP